MSEDLEPHSISEVLDQIKLDEVFAPRSSNNVAFMNPDVNYLWEKTGLDHRFVGHCLRSFGERVTLEGLRRCVEASINDPRVAWGLMRNVSTENVGGS